MTWEACCRYGIISTVPYEQQEINRQVILFQRIYYLSISLTGLPCHREPSIVLMSMLEVNRIVLNLVCTCRDNKRGKIYNSFLFALFFNYIHIIPAQSLIFNIFIK